MTTRSGRLVMQAPSPSDNPVTIKNNNNNNEEKHIHLCEVIWLVSESLVLESKLQYWFLSHWCGVAMATWSSVFVSSPKRMDSSFLHATHLNLTRRYWHARRICLFKDSGRWEDSSGVTAQSRNVDQAPHSHTGYHQGREGGFPPGHGAPGIPLWGELNGGSA